MDVDGAVGIVPTGYDEMVASVFEALVCGGGEELTDVDPQHAERRCYYQK